MEYKDVFSMLFIDGGVSYGYIKSDVLYTCVKATAKFRGRTYEAWFASDIPIFNGPWKFGGLPGLILSLTDSKNEYHFECIGIENLKNRNP